MCRWSELQNSKIECDIRFGDILCSASQYRNADSRGERGFKDRKIIEAISGTRHFNVKRTNYN